MLGGVPILMPVEPIQQLAWVLPVDLDQLPAADSVWPQARDFSV